MFRGSLFLSLLTLACVASAAENAVQITVKPKQLAALSDSDRKQFSDRLFGAVHWLREEREEDEQREAERKKKEEAAAALQRAMNEEITLEQKNTRCNMILQCDAFMTAMDNLYQAILKQYSQDKMPAEELNKKLADRMKPDFARKFKLLYRSQFENYGNHIQDVDNFVEEALPAFLTWEHERAEKARKEEEARKKQVTDFEIIERGNTIFKDKKFIFVEEAHYNRVLVEMREKNQQISTSALQEQFVPHFVKNFTDKYKTTYVNWSNHEPKMKEFANLAARQFLSYKPEFQGCCVIL